MADIRIKDLATTASSTAADDFLAVDGTTNGTRKLSAATPSFATSVTVPGVAGPTATDLTLAGGSTGASLVLGQGANASTVFTGTGTGLLSFTKATGNPEIRAIATPGGAGVFRAYTPSTSVLSVYGLYSVLEGNGNKWENGFYGTLDYVHRYNDSEKLRFTTTGNLLIGTTTDSGNGKLQLATHTTSAGGIGFGTDVSLFRSATGVLRLAGTSNYLHEIVNTAGTSAATTVYSNTGGNLFVGIDSSSGGAIGAGAYSGVISRDGAYPLILRTNGTTALTLASNQAATFAGAVSVNSVTPSTGAGSGALQVAGGIYSGAASVFGGNVTIPSSILYTNNIYNYTGGATPLTLGWTGSAAVLSLFSSGAATFAGVVVKKNYTVATLPAAASFTYGEAYVSDATQAAGTSLGSAPTGGGSVKRGVYSDGTSWLLR